MSQKTYYSQLGRRQTPAAEEEEEEEGIGTFLARGCVPEYPLLVGGDVLLP